MTKRKYPLEKDREIPYLSNFLAMWSESFRVDARNKIHDANEYFKKSFNKTLLEINAGEMLVFLRSYVDMLPIKKLTKRRWKDTLSAFYKYVKAYKKDIEGVKFKKPIPSNKTFDFSGTMQSLQQEKLNPQQLPTMNIIKKVIENIYYTRREDTKIYVAVCLIVLSGARVSEVAHVELEHLIIEQRWFFTLVKSPQTNKRMGVYFFPTFFVPTLEQYIRTVRLEHPETKYLFPSRGSHISKRTIEKHLHDIKKTLGLQTIIYPHIYRDFINTKHLDLGCQTPFLEFLLNQSKNGVNVSSYMKKYEDLLELRSLYDKYNPFSPDILPNPQL